MAATLPTLQPAGGRHGEGSDEKQQGKEEAEGRQEQAEGRARPFAVTIRSRAAKQARPEPLWQEGLGIGRPGKPRSPRPPTSGARRDGPQAREELKPCRRGAGPRSTSGKPGICGG